ncbi:MAG TPA: methytransferase partner Trm112 [Dehalococcoidia bacterium]|nr:methytransferase partner Trm112 [Dehalococcoidia bacterium]
MRRDLMDILACPVCKHELTLTVDREEDDEVIEGSLHCATCDETYPITDGIPNLLPPDLRREMETEAADTAS